MTKYRTINDGYHEWLQYLAEVEVGFWIFKRTVAEWKYVRSDRFDYFGDIWEDFDRRNGFGFKPDQRYISDRTHDLNAFVKKWPNIYDWMTHVSLVLDFERLKWDKKQLEIDSKKGVTRSL